MKNIIIPEDLKILAKNYTVPRAAKPERFLVGLSGGVDSSVTAWMLKQAGHEVSGVTLRLAPEHTGSRDHRCCAATDLTDAEKLCDQLGISFQLIDLRERFRTEIFQPFVQSYSRGETPSPCTTCNSSLKFGDLMALADTAGAKLATGHYVRLVDYKGRRALARPHDLSRDQSYFLYGLTSDVLDRVAFPLGEWENKLMIRALAEVNGLASSHKPDSQELCFAPDGDHASAVERALGGLSKGDFVDTTGKTLGQHEGIHRYTVGQRKGLPSGKNRLFVLDVNAASNDIVVGSRTDLACSHVQIKDLRCSVPRELWPEMVSVQVRSRPPAQEAKVLVHEILFTNPIEGISPGQVAVVYDGDVLLGGATISGRLDGVRPRVANV